MRVGRGRPRRALHSGTLFLTFARMLAQRKKNGGDDGKDGDDGDRDSNDCTHNKDKAEKEEREEDEEHDETETKTKDK